MARKTKRILACGDFHCGHRVGLTPPSHNDKPNASAENGKLAWYDLRKRMFDWWWQEMKSCGKIDGMICNGDLIDGRGERSGSTELIAVDRQEQCDMAREIIRGVKPARCVLSRGTPYHSGDIEDWENLIAREVDAEKIEDHGWLTVNGITFDYKHKVGSSSTPYGRHTPISKERTWNLYWSELGGAIKSNVFLRSHVHYASVCGDPDYMAFTLPALQGPGSKYGKRQCSGIVHFGFMIFDITPGGNMSWEFKTVKLLAKDRGALEW